MHFFLPKTRFFRWGESLQACLSCSKTPFLVRSFPQYRHGESLIGAGIVFLDRKQLFFTNASLCATAFPRLVKKSACCDKRKVDEGAFELTPTRADFT